MSSVGEVLMTSVTLLARPFSTNQPNLSFLNFLDTLTHTSCDFLVNIASPQVGFPINVVALKFSHLAIIIILVVGGIKQKPELPQN